MSDAPRLSVLIPACNAERWLRPALDSVLAQSFTGFELLVHDDGSTDGTLAILQDYAARDARLRVTSEPNKGIVRTLNGLLAAARGDLVARMDADDICLPERFAKQVAFLDAHPRVGVLGSFVDGIDADDRPLMSFSPPTDHAGLEAFHLQTGGPGLWHPAVMMRAEPLRSAGGYREDYPYCEDYDLWLRLGEVTELANLAEVLVQYRLHLQSLSVVKRDQQITSARGALQAACARRGLPEPPAPDTPPAPPTELDVMRKWAWWALGAGHVDTARTYARKSLARAPLSPASWKLWAVVLRNSLR
ncbi:glycosyltransferase [uncultured Roseobacter sp.]|uniref:glycosyltransferase family 2 protein n=1 Tax=uncultured Roseobacter sp. TaxID=114847 RepID=UPI002623C94E|nr:glycosyltransferase [uncultured Roseobacter sp.]